MCMELLPYKTLSAQIAIETERNTLPSTYLPCTAAVNTLPHTHGDAPSHGERCLTSQPAVSLALQKPQGV